MKLEGKTALVTGAAGHVGQAITLALAAEGVHCVCHFHQQETRTKELVKRIQQENLKAWALQSDFSYPQNAFSFFSEALKRAGSIEILVNSAAIFERCPLQEVTTEVIHRTFNVNVAVPLLLSRVFAEHRSVSSTLSHPSGSIVNLADAGAIRPWANYTAYCGSKAGLIGLTKSLARELAPAITVNAVAPGIVEESSPYNSAERERQLKRIPVGRFACASEIARAVLYCLTQDYLTGQVIAVDGGRTI